MFAESIVVMSAGRTGSQLVFFNLKRHFNCPVIHTHDALIECATDQKTVICRRKNNFDTIVSIEVGRRTGEFSWYVGKNIDPFVVSKDDFESSFWYVQHHQHVTQTRFPSSIIVEFETLISDSKYLFGLFGIDKETNYSFSKKSPYNACSLIQNYTECKSWFDQLSTHV